VFHAQVEIKASDHLFRAAIDGDEELAFWVLDMGAKSSAVSAPFFCKPCKPC